MLLLRIYFSTWGCHAMLMPFLELKHFLALIDSMLSILGHLAEEHQ